MLCSTLIELRPFLHSPARIFSEYSGISLLKSAKSGQQSVETSAANWRKIGQNWLKVSESWPKVG